jgi:hypothetical protein
MVSLAGCEPIRPSASEAFDRGWVQSELADRPILGKPVAIFQVNADLWIGANAPRKALFLTSEDGDPWRDQSSDVVDPDADVSFRAVAKGVPGWVLLVEEGSVEARHIGARFSVDGQSWSSVGGDVFRGAGEHVAIGAAWGGELFTVVGVRPEGKGRQATIVFSSADGIDWTQEHAADLTLSKWSVPIAVLAMDDRRIIVADGGNGGRASLLESTQHGAWRRQELAGLEDSRIRTASASGSGLMLGGCSNNPGITTAEIWTVPQEPGASPTPSQVADAANSCIDAFAIGSDETLALGRSANRAAAWSTSDAEDWSREPLTGTRSSRAAAGLSIGSEWFVVGERIEVTSSPLAQLLTLWRRGSS